MSKHFAATAMKRIAATMALCISVVYATNISNCVSHKPSFFAKESCVSRSDKFIQGCRYLANGDERTGIHLLKKASGEGCLQAQQLLSFHHICEYDAPCKYTGHNSSTDTTTRSLITSIIESARLGCAADQYVLAVCYENEMLVTNNEILSSYWLRKSADGGNAYAQYDIGVRCLVGSDCFTQDSAQASSLLSMAAKQSHVGAYYVLGVCYQAGLGGMIDYANAFLCYSNAAEMGCTHAQEAMGTCYEDSIGVARDLKKAFKWYEIAAYKGDATAQYELSQCYEYGTGVGTNPVIAAFWLAKAADGELIIAQERLAKYYSKGYGVVKDCAKANYWYRKAANTEKQHNEVVGRNALVGTFFRTNIYGGIVVTDRPSVVR